MIEWRYLELLRLTLTRMLCPDRTWTWDLLETRPMSPNDRAVGKDWPTEAETMVGLFRLCNIQMAIESVESEKVPGDIVETGVWRGGAAIYAKGVLEAIEVLESKRHIWCCDSFEGLPPPDPARYPADAGDPHSGLSSYLGVSVHTVMDNFRKYNLLDSRVHFVKGWFEETLPKLPAEKIAVLRLDGDMYSSTIQALDALYPKLSPGGFLIIDDFALPGCRQAVLDYRRTRNILEEVCAIDWTGIYWRKER